MSGLDFSRVDAAALSVLPSLLDRWLPDGRKHDVRFVQIIRGPIKDGSVEPF